MENENNNAALPGSIQPPAAGQTEPQPAQPGAVQPQPAQPGAVHSTQGTYPPAGYAGAGTAPNNTPSYGVVGADGWQQIVEQQQQQINALMAQNAALNGQVVSLVQGGGQLSAAAPQPVQQQMQPQAYNHMFPPQMPEHPTQIQQMMQLGVQPDPLATMNPPSLSDSADYSLEGLAEEIGKPKDEKSK